MKKYKVLLDDQVVDDGLSYREACELATELDEAPQNYFKDVDIVPMED